MREKVLQWIENEKVIAIVRGVEPEQCEAVAEALYIGGIRLLEITYDQENPGNWQGTADTIGRIAKKYEGRMFIGAGTVTNSALVPSINKGRHGFDGQKCPHTASSPLRIRQYSLRVFPCLVTFLLRQNCKAPASDEFTSDFWLLRRRRAGARQDEKGKKRRKDTLAGVFALVNRW